MEKTPANYTEALHHWKLAMSFLNREGFLQPSYTHNTVRALTNALQKGANAEFLPASVFKPEVL